MSLKGDGTEPSVGTQGLVAGRHAGISHYPTARNNT